MICWKSDKVRILVTAGMYTQSNCMLTGGAIVKNFFIWSLQPATGGDATSFARIRCDALHSLPPWVLGLGWKCVYRCMCVRACVQYLVHVKHCLQKVHLNSQQTVFLWRDSAVCLLRMDMHTRQRSTLHARHSSMNISLSTTSTLLAAVAALVRL